MCDRERFLKVAGGFLWQAMRKGRTAKNVQHDSLNKRLGCRLSCQPERSHGKLRTRLFIWTLSLKQLTSRPMCSVEHQILRARLQERRARLLSVGGELFASRATPGPREPFPEPLETVVPTRLLSRLSQRRRRTRTQEGSDRQERGPKKAQPEGEASLGVDTRAQLSGFSRTRCTPRTPAMA